MAQGKYDDFAATVIELVGGKDNVTNVMHCITRVRFVLKDESKADTETLEKTPGVIKIMQANGQYQVVVGNDKVEDVYDAIVKVGGFTPGGEVDVEEEEGGEKKGIMASFMDLISGIFQPMLGTFAAAGIMKGILALIVNFWPAFEGGGAYEVLYTIADGYFYFLPVVLGYTAAKKFGMNEFTGIAIGLSLVYPDMVAITEGEVLGTVSLGIFGDLSWYATFFGIPIIMPASGYTSSVIPVILMVALGAQVEKWSKKWMPGSVKMFFVPLLTMTVAVVFGYLVIGPVATIITNLLETIFNFLFNLPVVGRTLGTVIVAALWMPMVMFGFHWSTIPLMLLNLSDLGYDYVGASMIAHSFSLGAVLFAMYLKNKDETFRGVCMPAMITSFFFGITEPALYGVAIPDGKAFIVACIGSAAGGLVIGLTQSVVYMSGGMGVFNWLCFINPEGGMTDMIWAIVASMVGAVVGFVIEWIIYKPPVEGEEAAAA